MERLKELFYEVIDGKIDQTKLEKELRKIKKTKITKGYIHAMKVILGKRKRKHAIDPKLIDKPTIKALLEMINRRVESFFLPNYEKGYLYAWRDYLTKKLNIKK